MATKVLNSGVERPKRTKRAKSKSRQTSEEDILSDDYDLKTQTKASFDELMKQAITSANDQTGKSKKKKKKVDEQVKQQQLKQLESLRKGEGLRKDRDALLEANTYDPDDIKSSKSNKRRQKEREKNVGGKDNIAFEKDEVVTKSRTKKTPRKDDSIIEIDKEMSISELAPLKNEKSKKKTKHRKAEEPEVIEKPEGEIKKKKKKTPRDHDTSLEPDLEPTVETKKVKKKRKDAVIEEYEQQIKSRDLHSDADPTSANETLDESRVLSHDDEQNQEGATRKKKKKKKKAVTEEEERLSPRNIEDDGRVIGLTVHRTDKLKTDFWMAHPLVRVTFVDLDTGTYLKKQHSGRAVTSYFENENRNVDYIMPVMTQPYDFKRNKSTLPLWEELVVFNENFNYIIQGTPNVIVFFELLDYVTMNAASQKYAVRKQEGGWHPIAWCFLKILGANGKPNTDRKVRLQLYQPYHRSKPGTIEVYHWYKVGGRVPYPSTMYVTVKGIVPPDEVEPAARSMFPNQEEKGKSNIDEQELPWEKSGPLSARSARERESARAKEPSLWSRLPGQACKIPNMHHAVLPVGRKGASVVKFSNDGRALACASHDKDGYPVFIYEIPSMKHRGTIQAHFSLVYDLDWARGDRHIITASADGTARIWDTKVLSNTPVKILPHPAFIYTAKFHPRVPKIIMTGGYDRLIRLWSADGKDSHALLLQELDGHSSFVNTIAFDDEGQRLFSGDSVGQIRVWNIYVTDKPSSNGLLREATLHKVINETELKDVCINGIKVHVNGRRLLVHCRDNHIRMIDLRVNAVMQRYVGALNFRDHIRSDITPCGTFVVSGSEDGCAYVWNTETGDQVASYSELGFASSVCSVDFHPHEHMVAFCSLAENSPVLVYKYDHGVAQKEAGLELQMCNLDEKTKEEIMETSRKVRTLQEDFKSNEMSRYERIQRKLNTVTAYSLMDQEMKTPRATSPTMATVSTWGATFDTRSLRTRERAKAFMKFHRPMDANSPEPGMFSPHASRTYAPPSIEQHQFSAQSEYMRQSATGWRPTFSELGKAGSMRSSAHYGRPPQLSINAMQGKPQFTFQGKISKETEMQRQDTANLNSRPAATYNPFESAETHTHNNSNDASRQGSIRLPGQPQVASAARYPMNPTVIVQQPQAFKVVALYDYHAQRSDELSLVKDDVIKVLYRDNENWWMGELEDGQQGFFPVNYVTGYDLDKQEAMDLLAQYKTTLGDGAEEEEADRSLHAAVKTRTGELKFISGAEDSDAETTARRKKRTGKSRDSVTLETELQDLNSTSSRQRRRSKNVAESTA